MPGPGDQGSFSSPIGAVPVAGKQRQSRQCTNRRLSWINQSPTDRSSRGDGPTRNRHRPAQASPQSTKLPSRHNLIGAGYPLVVLTRPGSPEDCWEPLIALPGLRTVVSVRELAPGRSRMWSSARDPFRHAKERKRDMATVSFKGATRVYPGSDSPAVDKLDLDIADGEFLVLVGPSGCGKSTSLRMLAGLEEVDEGSIYIGDRDVTNSPPKERDIAMVFQNYALYPHMTVADNMGFALKMRGVPKDERVKRVAEAAQLLGIEEYLDRKPKALSGGQRQRVAMGRAIVREPQVFLMDEPLSNLDAKLRVQTRTQIAELQQRLGVTTVYVTHDQVEAMTMGDRVAVLKDGRLQQVDTPLRPLRPAGERVRRGLHGLAGDESDRG